MKLPRIPLSARTLAGAACAALCLAPIASNAQTAAKPVANTPYAIGAQRSGVDKCIGRINQVTSFLTGANANSGIMLNSPASDVNQKIATAIIEVEGGGVSSFVSASFAPGPGAGDCSATYDAVTYWQASCSQVASSNFAAFKPTRPLLKSVSTLDGGPTTKIFLMPAGSGCVSIKKEILY